MKNQSNERGSKYGNLLDGFMDSGNTKDYNGTFVKESENRYGNLMRDVSQNNKYLDTMETMVNSMDDLKRKRAEENCQFDEKIRKRIERKKQEHEERADKNNAFINDFLQKKENEQKMEEIKAQERERREAKEQKVYSDIDKLINIDPKLADAYVDLISKM